MVSTGDHTRYKAMGHLNNHSRPQRLKPRDINAKLKDSYQLISSSILPCCSTNSKICSYYQHLSSSTNLRPYSPHIHESITYLIGSSLAWADPYVKNLTPPAPPIHPLTPPGQQLLWESRRQISEPTLNLGQFKLQDRCNKTMIL